MEAVLITGIIVAGVVALAKICTSNTSSYDDGDEGYDFID